MNYVLAVSAGVVAGVAIGIVIEKNLAKMNASNVMERSEILRNTFGEPMCTTKFSLNEAKEWIKARQNLLDEGSKAIVLKANSQTMKNLGKTINLDGVENYLIIAVVSKANDIQNSVLIKYEKLDDELEKLLEKGNGTLVVEA